MGEGQHWRRDESGQLKVLRNVFSTEQNLVEWKVGWKGDAIYFGLFDVGKHPELPHHLPSVMHPVSARC